MAVRGRVETDEAGALVQVEVDADTGEELRRFRLPVERQPARVRMAEVAEASGRELQLWQFRLDHVGAYGLSGAPLAALTSALTQARDAAAARDLAALGRWRQAPAAPSR